MATEITELNEVQPGFTLLVMHRNGYANITSEVGPATVTRLTRTQIEVRNKWGNLCKYYLSNGKAVGAADPFDYYFVSING